ncbi:hypothetical protein D3C78_1678900 [compost metagenome]
MRKAPGFSDREHHSSDTFTRSVFHKGFSLVPSNSSAKSALLTPDSVAPCGSGTSMSGQ